MLTVISSPSTVKGVNKSGGDEKEWATHCFFTFEAFFATVEVFDGSCIIAECGMRERRPRRECLTKA